MVLLNNLINSFGCGKCYIRKNQPAGDFIIENFSDIVEKLIPFFDKYPILGIKSLDYVNFKTVVGIMQSKEHLTLSGLEKIRKLKSEMNISRENN
jgi:hypothetical protein